MLLRTTDQTPLSPPPLVIEAAGQRFRQTAQFLYLGGIIHESRDLLLENRRRGSSHAGMPQTVRPGVARHDDRCIFPVPVSLLSQGSQASTD